MFQITNTFSLFGLTIHLYSVTLLVGILIAWLYGRYNMLKKGFDPSKYDGFVIFVVMVALFIGARGWYVISNWSEYSWNWSKIIAISEGGLAIQGGIVAGAAAAPLYIKLFKPGFKIMDVIDIAATSILFGQIAGRFGNFFNQEVYGSVVENKSDIEHIVKVLYYTFWFGIIGGQALRKPWEKIKQPGVVVFYEKIFFGLFILSGAAVLIGTTALGWVNAIVEGMFISGKYRMPLFLIEATINLGGIMVLAIMIPKMTNKKGVQFGAYFAWYGLVRIMLEPLRNSTYNMSTSMGMSIAFVVFGTIAICYFLFGHKIRRTK